MNKQSIPKLLNVQYDRLSGPELSSYIRELKSTVATLKLQNDYLSNKEQYIKDLSDVTVYPFNCEKLEPLHVERNGDAYAITATFDPQRFKQLCITPQYEQIKYFKKIFSKLIYDGEIDNLYCVFESHKNGNIHCHAITYIYNNEANRTRLENCIKCHLTNRSRNTTNTVIKPVDNVDKWFTYMNKEWYYSIEYNLRKKSLDL